MEKNISLSKHDVITRCVKRAISSELWDALDTAKSDLVIEVVQPTDSLHLIATGLGDDAPMSVQQELAFATWDILTTVRMQHEIPPTDPLTIQFLPDMRRTNIVYILSGKAWVV